MIFVDGRSWDRLWQWPQATELLFYRGRRHRICSMVMMKEMDIIGLYISLSIHSHCFLCDIFFLSMTKSNKMTNDVLFRFLLKKIYIIYIYIYMYMYVHVCTCIPCMCICVYTCMCVCWHSLDIWGILLIQHNFT